MQKLFLGAQTNQMVILTAHENPLTTAFWAGHLPRGLQFHWSAVTEAKNKQIENGKSFFLLTFWEQLLIILISTRRFAKNAHQQFNVSVKVHKCTQGLPFIYEMGRLLVKSIRIRSSQDIRNGRFYVYCVNAHYYTKNNFLCSINILPHSNKHFERLNLKKSATIFYQH